MKLFIGNGLIVDPLRSYVASGSLMIEDGIITEVLFDGEEKEADFLIDARGKWIVPGLIDLHVHLREPGFEYKEDIDSGCAAAAKGGYTTICCMPNTSPVIDTPDTVSDIDKRAREGNGVQLLCIGAITKDQAGNEMADYKGMVSAQTVFTGMTGRGICGISEDGKTVMDEKVMIEAMNEAKKLRLTVFSHAEPEADIVRRDLKLVEQTGCRLHFCHISKKESIELIREAKKSGLPVTAETAPHYFTLDDSLVNGDPNKKMNPPLRTKEDVKAVAEALKDGTIDIIATDHAPHHERDKKLPFEDAANGVTGLDTSFQVSYTMLVKTGILTPIELIYKMSTKPAEILGIDRGSLLAGKAADIAVIDVEKQYEINPSDFLSKGKNSAFIGMNVFGETEYTIINGNIVWGGTENDRQIDEKN
ncbi:MAG: dihydroorotase [Eubacteriales bacterium]|nr:dihydroorotase [Eubacteriales bacterium]MDD3198742.1 dihydroorotase [Eubacteriales bacterium]MDD4629012.1 dihydroorotase [Eubacteriales bacterium]